MGWVRGKGPFWEQVTFLGATKRIHERIPTHTDNSDKKEQTYHSTSSCTMLQLRLVLFDHHTLRIVLTVTQKRIVPKKRLTSVHALHIIMML